MNIEDHLMTSVEESSESDEEYPCSYEHLPLTSTASTSEDVSIAAKHHCGQLHCTPHSNPQIASQNGFVYPQFGLINGVTDRVVKYQMTPSTQANAFVSPDMLRNSLIWDQWLCCLATTLTPQQWQHYWTNYLILFGTSALPPHLANFFNLATRQYEQRNSSDHIQQQTIHGMPVVLIEDVE